VTGQADRIAPADTGSGAGKVRLSRFKGKIVAVHKNVGLKPKSVVERSC